MVFMNQNGSETHYIINDFQSVTHRLLDESFFHLCQRSTSLRQGRSCQNCCLYLKTPRKWKMMTSLSLRPVAGLQSYGYRLKLSLGYREYQNRMSDRTADSLTAWSLHFRRYGSAMISWRGSDDGGDRRGDVVTQTRTKACASESEGSWS